jgi:hypothetical protein
LAVTTVKKRRLRARRIASLEAIWNN